MTNNPPKRSKATLIIAIFLMFVSVVFFVMPFIPNVAPANITDDNSEQLNATIVTTLKFSDGTYYIKTKEYGDKLMIMNLSEDQSKLVEDLQPDDIISFKALKVYLENIDDTNIIKIATLEIDGLSIISTEEYNKIAEDHRRTMYITIYTFSPLILLFSILLILRYKNILVIKSTKKFSNKNVE